MKICFITPYYPPNSKGGMEISLSLLAQALAKRGHQVSIFTPNYQRNYKVDGTNPKVFRLKWPSDSVFFRTNPIAIRLFARKIDSLNIKFDIVDSYSWFQPGEILSKRRNIPHIASLRDSTPICDFRIEVKPRLYSTKEYFRKRITNYGFRPRQLVNAIYGYNLTRANHNSLKKASCLFCASEALTNIVKPLNNCTKVINSIAKPTDTNVAKKISIPGIDFNRDKIIVYAGRLSSGKGAYFLYKAALRIIANDQNNNLKFIFIGEGELQSKICKNGSRQIICLGKKDNKIVQQIISNSFITIIPSLVFEAFPRLAVESLSVNTPSIGTDVGGIPEAIGKAGIIIKPNNVNDLVAAILRVVNDFRLYKKLKKATQLEAKKYQEETIYQKVISNYREVIDEFRHNS